MGASIHAVAFRPPDEQWKKMKAAWDSCKAAGIDPPKEVQKFFAYDEPDEAGVEIRLSNGLAESAVSKWDDGDMREGYEINIEKLRELYPQITRVRVYVSY